ncbi:hypothetical protein BH09PSE5_BH09PSE5_46360 [soil metagenome]
MFQSWRRSPVSFFYRSPQSSAEATPAGLVDFEHTRPIAHTLHAEALEPHEHELLAVHRVLASGVEGVSRLDHRQLMEEVRRDRAVVA